MTSPGLEEKMQIAMETKKMFGFIKDEGKWYWSNKHDPDLQAGPFDTFADALDDAVKPYFDGST